MTHHDGPSPGRARRWPAVSGSSFAGPAVVASALALALWAGRDDAPLRPPADEPAARGDVAAGIAPCTAAVADDAARTAAPPLVETAPHRTAATLRIALGRTARQLGADALLAGNAAGVPAPLLSIVDDRDAIELMLLGRVDFALCGADVSEHDRRAGLCGTVLGAELFALAVAEQSQLRALSGDRLRALLRGAVPDGAELGLPPGPIRIGVPAEPVLRDRAARALIPGDAFAAAATPVDGDRGAFDLLLREPGAVAVVRVAAARSQPGLHLLPIDGLQPVLGSGQRTPYPAVIPLVLVTAGPPAGQALALLLRLRSGRTQLPAGLGAQ